MFYETAKNNHGLKHNPMKALVVPRPIGWITAMSAKGELNLSPYSFFNLISVRPDVVAFSSEGRKDAITFVEETKEFVVNIATWNMRHKLHETSAVLPRGQSEFDHVSLESEPSKMVAPPRVKGCPAALECKWFNTVRLNPNEDTPGRYILVIGHVVGAYIDDNFVKDGIVDSASMKPIARGGYMDYFVTEPENRFSMQWKEGVTAA